MIHTTRPYFVFKWGIPGSGQLNCGAMRWNFSFVVLLVLRNGNDDDDLRTCFPVVRCHPSDCWWPYRYVMSSPSVAPRILDSKRYIGS